MVVAAEQTGSIHGHMVDEGGGVSNNSNFGKSTIVPLSLFVEVLKTVKTAKKLRFLKNKTHKSIGAFSSVPDAHVYRGQS